MLHQRTLQTDVHGEGIGLHSGRVSRFRVRPAPVDSGVVFVRVDLERSREIPARAENVEDTRLATTLTAEGASVQTVEHLVAALAGLGVDNARIEVDGPEIPILDGSSAPFVEMIREAGGTVAQRQPKRFLVIRKTVSVSDGDKIARLEPATHFSLKSTIDFDHPIVTRQTFELSLSDTAFVRELARARTFGFARDIDALRTSGRALGGCVDNAVVVDDFSVRNPDGLRFPDEFVRHKMLDAIGDLALFGAPLIGRYTGVKSGHALNLALVRAVFEQRAFEMVAFKQRREADSAQVELPVFRLGRLAPI